MLRGKFVVSVKMYSSSRKTPVWWNGVLDRIVGFWVLGTDCCLCFCSMAGKSGEERLKEMEAEMAL